MKDFYKKYYGQLVGGSITGFALEGDDEGNEWPTFKVMIKGKNGKRRQVTIEVSCDPEGNAPGFLFGLPTP